MTSLTIQEQIHGLQRLILQFQSVLNSMLSMMRDRERTTINLDTSSDEDDSDADSPSDEMLEMPIMLRQETLGVPQRYKRIE